MGSWFVGVESIRDKLLKANSQIYWQPEHIKAGRFGKWLEGARGHQPQPLLGQPYIGVGM